MTFKMSLLRADGGPFGSGAYYVRRPDTGPGEQLVEVVLANPMYVNGRQANMLAARYGTGAVDPHARYAGAEQLRLETLKMGHDGIVAVGWPGGADDVTVVEFTEKPAHKHQVKEIMMKELRDYLKDATRVDEARKRVEILSDGEKTKKALYDLKRQLDSIDQLTNFRYAGRRPDAQAMATFEVKDRESFDALVERVEKIHGCKLILNG